MRGIGEDAFIFQSLRELFGEEYVRELGLNVFQDDQLRNKRIKKNAYLAISFPRAKITIDTLDGIKLDVLGFGGEEMSYIQTKIMRNRKKCVGRCMTMG